MKAYLILDKVLIRVLAAVLMAGLGGCGNFFETKPTEKQAAAILEELGQVKESPHIANPLPAVYRQPASRLPIKGGVKLFYFTRHHPAADIALLVKEQMGIAAHVNAASNQLVLYCKNDAQADQLEQYLDRVDVPPVQVNIDCLILERFGDKTMDWESSIMMENFLGEQITLGEKLGATIDSIGTSTFNVTQNGVTSVLSQADYPAFDFDSAQVGQIFSLDPAFPGASIRETERSSFGMDFGAWINKGEAGHQVRAIVDTLESMGYLKILLNPTLETVNGQQATVTMKDFTPVEKVKTGRGGASDAYNITEYEWVEDTVTVTPTVYADGSVGLNTSIVIGSRSKPEGVIQRAIITERSINVAENRIQPGKSLIIGGMRKSEKRSVVRGVPFFKDLPILGILFSSKDFEEKGTEIIFILTPSISSGGEQHKDVVERIRQKHDDPQYKMNLTDVITEPISSSVYTSIIEQEATEAEKQRIRARVESEQARKLAKIEKQRADEAVANADRLRLQAESLAAQAAKAAKAAEAAAAETEKAKELKAKQLEELKKLQQQKQKAIEAAQKAQQAAEKAKQQAENAEKAVQKAQQELDKADGAGQAN